MFWFVTALLGLAGATALLTRAARSTTRTLPGVAATTSPAPEVRTMTTRKVLFLGDSLTAGGYWREVKLPDTVTGGRGWGGEGTQKILKAALPLIATEQPTDVVLLTGVNGVASKHTADKVKADLTAAWTALKGTGARVWAVKLTPWFGYTFKRTKYHPAGPVTDAMRATTREVNGWMQSVAGSGPGPDYVIDTSALGDADYVLKPEYSADGLHLSKRGKQALALIVQQALAATAPRTTAVGGEDLDRALAWAVETFTDRLKRNDIPPATTRTDGKTVVFGFYTPFRKQRADELLPSGTKFGAQYIYLRTEVIGEAEIGQVAATDQTTPWTCGPAALRAVLAHHGDDVDEDTVATLAGNVPVLGVRPSGLVTAARELGYYVSAAQLRGPGALAPFLARDLPVLCVVDSWTQPGKAGHWVVVTAVGPSQVTVMDPHTPGNWRTLTPAEFDARWWHREGGRVVRRFAVIVVPQAFVAVGKDAPPAHGRLAKCTGNKWDVVGEYFGKAWRTVMKSMLGVVSGGGKLTGPLVDAWADKFHIGVKNMKAEERRNFFNTASNEELFIWSVGWARDGYDQTAKDHGSGNKQKAWRFIETLGITGAALRGDPDEVARETLRTLLWYGAWAPMSLPTCVSQAAIQAHLILHYGPLAETWEPIVRKKRTLPKGDGFVKIPAWVNAIMADLDAYKAAHAADEPERDFA